MGLRILVDHFGMPQLNQDPEAGFSALLEAENVYVMLSGNYRFSSNPEYVKNCADRLLKRKGPSRLVWASDYPFTRYRDTGLTVAGQLSQLELWVEDARSREIILKET